MQRIVERTCKTPFQSMGQKWQVFENVFKEMGAFEFELFIQANIDARIPTIEARGFYPSILLDEHSIEHYQERRDVLLETWKHPSKRYRSPMFTTVFPSELELAEEYLARVCKSNPAQGFRVEINQSPEMAERRELGGEITIGHPRALSNEVYNASVAEVRDRGSGFWLMTEFSVEELQNYYSSESPQWKLVKRDRVKLLSLGDRRLLRREKWRAQIESACVVARRYLDNRQKFLEVLNLEPEPHFVLGDDPKVVGLRNENPLLPAVCDMLLKIVPPGKPQTFNIKEDGLAPS